VQLWQICRDTQFHFTYALDDPYIHLALAERMRHGLYGINAGEPASSASSILWPFLLLPFAGTRFYDFVPLIFNFVFGAMVAYLFGALLDRCYPPKKITLSQRGMVWLTAALMLLSTNLFGLTFMGLEHVLELLLCIACGWLVVFALEGERIPLWCMASAALLPAVRYEGLLVTLAVVATLCVYRYLRQAAAVLIASLLPVVLFSLFLHHLGLPLLPLSVLVKGATITGSGDESKVAHLFLVAQNALRDAFLQPERGVILILAIIVLLLAIRMRRNLRAALTLLAVFCASMVQLLFGPFGWSYRYEVYIIGFVLPILVAAYAGQWAAHADTSTERALNNPRPQPAMLAAALCSLAWVYFNAFLCTPNSAQSIYRQQGQMARFTHDFYHGPVAINDMGMVADHRSPDQYVLDFAALGSYEVFRVSREQRTPQYYAETAHRHHVGLVMVYPEWIQAPDEWRPVAKLCEDDMRMGPANRRTMMYATRDSNMVEIMQALSAFRPTMPRGTTLDILPGDSGPDCTGS